MPSPLSLYRELTKQTRNYLRELSPKDVELVRRYQEASDINELLRRGALGGVAKTPWHEQRRIETETLDRILREAPVLPEDLRVFRAAPRGVYPAEEKGYLSTSFSRDGAKDFLSAMDSTLDPHDMYMINVTGDTPYLAPHNLVPDYTGQKELIFPRGAMLLRSEDERGLDYLRGNYAEGGLV